MLSCCLAGSFSPWAAGLARSSAQAQCGFAEQRPTPASGHTFILPVHGCSSGALKADHSQKQSSVVLIHSPHAKNVTACPHLAPITVL